MMLSSSFPTEPLSDRVLFWSDPERWPADTKWHVFAARAVQKLGRIRFGDKWSDAAASTRLVFPLPSSFSPLMEMRELRRGVKILCEIDGPYRSRALMHLGDSVVGVRDLPMPVADEWSTAVARAEELSDESWRAFHPFLAVARELALASKDGTIKTFTCARAGGEMRLQPWWFWNVDWPSHRFDTCSGSSALPDNPLARQMSGDRIFLDRVQLEEYCAGISVVDARLPSPVEVREELEKQSRSRGRPRHGNHNLFLQRFVSLVHQGAVSPKMPYAAMARMLLDSLAQEVEQLPAERTVTDWVSTWAAEYA